MKLSERMEIIELNPIENINIFWCYIVINIFSYLPEFLEENVIGYILLLAVFSFLLKEYFENREIKFKYLLGNVSINFVEIISLVILTMGVQILFRCASLYIFSYISPSRLLNYLSEPTFYVLTIPTFVHLVIITPILEELFFRGILLNRLKGLSLNRRLIISSIIFGVLHLEWFIPTGIMGYIFGYAYLKTRSFIIPVILHSIVNLSAFVLRNFKSEDEMIHSIIQVRSDLFYPFLVFLVLLPLYIFLFRKFWFEIKSFSEVPYIKNIMREEIQ